MLASSKYYLPSTIALASIFAFVQYNFLNPLLVISWLLAITLINVARLFLYHSYLHHPLQHPGAIQRRMRWFRHSVFLGGCAWGAAGLLLFTEIDSQHQIFLIFMLAGISVSGAIAYSADFISAALYVFITIMPLGISLLMSDGVFALYIFMALLLFLFFMLNFLRQLNRNRIEQINTHLLALQNEEKVRLSEERYRLLLNHSPIGIFHFDKDLNIIFCNDIIVSKLHSTTNLIVGLDMRTLQDQSLVQPCQDALAGKIGHYEGLYKATFTDISIWISMSCAPSRNKNGEIIGGIGIVQDMTESKKAADEIKNLAYYDPLTQLPNRRLLLDWLQQALASSARTEKSGALLFIDLDNFKAVNDAYGHDTGDLLLQQVAKRIVACVRDNDTVARLSGDEFVVILELLSETGLKAAAQTEMIGDKIRNSLNQPYQLGSLVHRSTPSMGATLFHGNSPGPEEIIKQADIAMYEAKKSGRNTLRFFDPLMQEAINQRTTLEVELNNALEQNQFELFYQIQVDSNSRYLGAEVLLRWKHPELGQVSPAEFIPLAEETGLITPIGRWVLNTACDQIKAWQAAEHTRDLTLAVNISAKQFGQPDFIEQVRSAVNRHIINPRLLKLELTESLVLDNLDRIISTMNELKDIGILFSLDDFGTGYSSLQYLKRLPLDQLKIDQSFVRDLEHNNNDKAIVSTIIAMAHSLNLDVIAEGVETEEQKQFLLQRNCRHYQGYLFSKPLPLPAFEALLLAGAG